MRKICAKSSVIKIPCQLEEFRFRKTTQDWVIAFSIQPEQLDFAKPLMKQMNESFIIAAIHVKDITDTSMILSAK